MLVRGALSCIGVTGDWSSLDACSRAPCRQELLSSIGNFVRLIPIDVRHPSKPHRIYPGYDSMKNFVVLPAMGGSRRHRADQLSTIQPRSLVQRTGREHRIRMRKFLTNRDANINSRRPQAADCTWQRARQQAVRCLSSRRTRSN